MLAGWSAALDELNAPFTQQFKAVLLVGDELQGVFVGHIFPEIPPPPANGTLQPVVGSKTFLTTAFSEVVADIFPPVIP